MSDEEKKVPEAGTPEDNYIEVIRKLKESSVSKDEYERVLKENKTLAEAFATGPAAEPSAPESPVYTQKDIDDLAVKMSGGHLSNLDFTRAALKYRDAVMAVHGVDPFLPNSSGYSPTDADRAQAQEIADGLRQIAEYSGNDPKLFNSELKRCAH